LNAPAELRDGSARRGVAPDRDEERALLAAAQAGDRRAEDTLVRSQLPWLFGFAHAYARRHPHYPAADVYADGLRAVLRCVRGYDLGARRCRLLALVKVAVRRHADSREPSYWPGISLAAGHDRRASRPRPVRAAGGPGPDDRDPLGSVGCPWDDDHAEARRLDAAADRVLDALPPRDAAIVALRYGLDGTGEAKPVTDVALVMGVCPATVRRVLRAALRGARGMKGVAV
jgi:DNA-directed RNA polymerase specialized sigma24 family protein